MSTSDEIWRQASSRGSRKLAVIAQSQQADARDPSTEGIQATHAQFDVQYPAGEIERERGTKGCFLLWGIKPDAGHFYTLSFRSLLFRLAPHDEARRR